MNCCAVSTVPSRDQPVPVRVSRERESKVDAVLFHFFFFFVSSFLETVITMMLDANMIKKGRLKIKLTLGAAYAGSFKSNTV